MNGNDVNETASARSSAGESSSTGWFNAGDAIRLVSCLLAGGVGLLL